MIQFSEYFQMGWFNHQLEFVGRCFANLGSFQTEVALHSGKPTYLENGPLIKDEAILIKDVYIPASYVRWTEGR